MAINPPSRPFHWPGGIPSAVRPGSNGDITDEQANEEAKGWLLFVAENWTPRDAADIPDEDGDYEVNQRRSLVEKWATASQEFRDSYQQRAPVQDAMAYPEAALFRTEESFPTESHFLCLAPLSNRSNRSKWIKLYILSCRLDGEAGHCLSIHGQEHTGFEANPATFPDQSTFQITDFLVSYFLEMANFAGISMTSRGTVLFLRSLDTWYLVDQHDLDTGRISSVEFKRNGQIDEIFKRRAFNMAPVYLSWSVGCLPLREVKEVREGGHLPQMNAELDMTLPVIDILEGARDRDEFIPDFEGDRDGWLEDIEIYAPGYLAMEAEGNEAEYDHGRLIDPDEAYDVRQERYMEQIRNGQ